MLRLGVISQLSHKEQANSVTRYKQAGGEGWGCNVVTGEVRVIKNNMLCYCHRLSQLRMAFAYGLQVYQQLC